MGKRGHDGHYRLRSSWRRFAELRFNERHVYLEAFGGFGSGPGFGFKDLRIYLDGAIVGRAWRGACSLGFGGGVGPAVAMLRDDLALRVDLDREFGIDPGREELELLTPTIPGRPPRTLEEQSVLDVVARTRRTIGGTPRSALCLFDRRNFGLSKHRYAARMVPNKRRFSPL